MKIPLTLFLVLMGTLTYCQDYITLKTAPEKQVKAYKKAVAAYRQNKYDDAIKLFEKIIKSEPKFIDAHILLGSVFFEKKTYSSAEKSFIDAIKLDSTYQVKVFLYINLAVNLSEVIRLPIAW